MASSSSPWASAFSCSLLRDLLSYKVCLVPKDPTFSVRVLTKAVGIDHPKLMLVVGGVGLALNIISGLFLHGRCIGWLNRQLLRYCLEHDHDHSHIHEEEEAQTESTNCRQLPQVHVECGNVAKVNVHDCTKNLLVDSPAERLVTVSFLSRIWYTTYFFLRGL